MGHSRTSKSPQKHPHPQVTPGEKGGKGNQNPKIIPKSPLGEWVGLEGGMEWKEGGAGGRLGVLGKLETVCPWVTQEGVQGVPKRGCHCL